MITEFERNPQFYSGKSYLVKSKFQIIAYMQHYGAPTRLLDFTISPYVASFFSVESSQEYSSIYAINYIELLETTKKLFLRKQTQEINEVTQFLKSNSMSNYKVFDNLVLRKDQLPFVELVQPFSIFDWLRIQQGVFLTQGNINQNFESNLNFNHKISKELNQSPMYKIKIPLNWEKEILKDLNRMNINYYSLFPGLNGFFKSLNNKFVDLIEDQIPLMNSKHINKNNGS